MALAKLSVVHANLGDAEKAKEYSHKAIEKAEALPPGERYYIEGRHYSLDPASTEKAVAAYQKAVDAAPDHTAARNNLAQTLIYLRRYPEALVHLEELRRRGMSFPGSYMSLAETYLATGQPEKAREALNSYVVAHPDSSAGLENLGFFELAKGKTDAALVAFDKAASLEPAEMAEDRDGPRHRARDARRVARGGRCAKRLIRSDDPRERWQGGATLAIASLYRGDVGEARRLAAEGIKTGATAYERVGARLFRAQLESDWAATGGPRRGGEGHRRGGCRAEAQGRGPRHAGSVPRAARPARGGREERGRGGLVPRDAAESDRRAQRGCSSRGSSRSRAGTTTRRAPSSRRPPSSGRPRRSPWTRRRSRSSSRSPGRRSPRATRRRRARRSPA